MIEVTLRSGERVLYPDAFDWSCGPEFVSIYEAVKEGGPRCIASYARDLIGKVSRPAKVEVVESPDVPGFRPGDKMPYNPGDVLRAPDGTLHRMP